MKTILLLVMLALSACKLVIPVPEGGRVASASGAYDCETGQTCEVDVVDFFFDERFSAEAADGQVFLGWQSRDNGLCGGWTGDCPLVTSAFEGVEQLEQVLTSDEAFYLEPVFAVQGGPIFNVRYCEMLIARLVDGMIEAEVWNSQSLNLCPAEGFRQIDAAAIAAETGALAAIVNGPRYWVIDDSQVVSLPPGFVAAEGIRTTFGGVEMQLITTVRVPLSAAGGLDAQYQVAEVARDTVFTYFAGRRVYELTDPDGTRYLMQSFTRAVDPRQDITELKTLGERLELPDGWSWRTYVLDEEFELTSDNGVALVATDDLGNTYQRIPE